MFAGCYREKIFTFRLLFGVLELRVFSRKITSQPCVIVIPFREAKRQSLKVGAGIGKVTT